MQVKSFYRPLVKLEHSFIDTIENFSCPGKAKHRQTPPNLKNHVRNEAKSESRKIDFPNKYNNDLLSNVFDLFNFSCYFSQCRRSLPQCLHIFHLFFLVHLDTVYNRI